MKVFSPRVGAKVLLKVENLTNGAIFFEKEVSTTVAYTWEDLVFNFTAINTANSYQNIVFLKFPVACYIAMNGFICGFRPGKISHHLRVYY